MTIIQSVSGQFSILDYIKNFKTKNLCNNKTSSTLLLETIINDIAVFPPKNNPAAKNKVNIYLRHAMCSYILHGELTTIEDVNTTRPSDVVKLTNPTQINFETFNGNENDYEIDVTATIKRLESIYAKGNINDIIAISLICHIICPESKIKDDVDSSHSEHPAGFVADMSLFSQVKACCTHLLAQAKRHKTTALEAAMSIYNMSGISMLLADESRARQNQNIKEQISHISARIQSTMTFLSHFPIMTSNDMCTGWYLWWCCEATCKRESIAVHILNHARNADVLKHLSATIKQVGVNTLPYLCNYTELNTLFGRDVFPQELDVDMRRRVTTNENEMSCVPVDRELLISTIKSIYRECITTTPEYQDRDEYWNSRWQFTKSGSHNHHIEKRAFGKNITPSGRNTRKTFSEYCDNNVILATDPCIIATPSVKKEHGKDRWLYNCDTISYYNFDYLLRPIERVWRSNKVLLDPQFAAKTKMYDSISKHKQYNLMLDFDDFNSQHSLASMAAVFEALDGIAPPAILEWCVKAQHNQYIHTKDGNVKLTNTLFSGHRATTFINTVLNAAYIRLALQRCEHASTELRHSFHAGDDVLMQFLTLAGCEELLEQMTKLGFRLNPTKQSIGVGCGEFLRTQFTPSFGRAYVARSIASLVSGNWITDDTLTTLQTLTTFRQAAVTLNNRSMIIGAHTLMLHSLINRAHTENNTCTTRRLADVLDPANAINNGVSYTTLTNTKTNLTFTLDLQTKRVSGEPFSKHNAVRDFINHHLNNRVLDALGLKAGELVNPMRRMSEGGSTISVWNGGMSNTPINRGTQTSVQIVLQYNKIKDPYLLWPMNLFPNRFTPEQLRHACQILQVNLAEFVIRDRRCVRSCYGIPYADAEMCQERFSTTILLDSPYKVFA